MEEGKRLGEGGEVAEGRRNHGARAMEGGRRSVTNGGVSRRVGNMEGTGLRMEAQKGAGGE
eukprot:4746701-Pyramimonas_sp.AAC.1